MFSRRLLLGVSLIETVIFIVVLGIGFGAIFVLYNGATRGSVDPLVRKQALAIATSLIEEIELRGFTYCDPNDPAVYTATSTADCTTAEALGPEPGETRYADPRFNNVNDYAGFPAMSGAGIKDIANNPISATGLNGYSVTIAVANITGGELPLVTNTNDALRITVSVSGPTGVSVTLQGYRLRYAPNSP
jgi:MSHA pilin protein MshD